MVKLIDVKRNQNFVIEKIDIEDGKIVKQLKNLLIDEGRKISLLYTNYGAKTFMVKVDGTSFAIDRKIAEKIFVKEIGLWII